MLVMYAAYASEDMAAGEFGRGLTSILRSRWVASRCSNCFMLHSLTASPLRSTVIAPATAWYYHISHTLLISFFPKSFSRSLFTDIPQTFLYDLNLVPTEALLCRFIYNSPKINEEQKPWLRRRQMCCWPVWEMLILTSVINAAAWIARFCLERKYDHIMPEIESQGHRSRWKVNVTRVWAW